LTVKLYIHRPMLSQVQGVILILPENKWLS